MAKYDYDLFVIGGGSGGVRAARISGGHGAKVAVAEEYRYGGTCVIRGCIPKKLLVYASGFPEAMEDAAGYGWTFGAGSFDWKTLIANKDKEIARLEGIYQRLLTGAGVTAFAARATLEDAHTLRVGDSRVTAERILVATGGRPVKPDVAGIEHAITSNEAFHLAELPRRVAIVGGGYIACEFAGIFNGLGAEVAQLYRGDCILRGFDDDVRATVAEEMARHGVDLRTRIDVRAIERRSEGLRLSLNDGAALTVDCVLYATGRRPNTDGIGLEAAGVALDRNGAVTVDEWSRSSAAHIYAVGDVTDRIQLTPVATHEAHCLADTLFGNRPRRPDHELVASAVFSQPEVATVGLGEEAARAKYGEVDIYRTSFRALKHTLTGREDRTMMKLVVDPASDRVLGAHMVGEHAGEIVQGIAIALKCGATKAQFDQTIGIHPTAAEEFVTMRTKAPPRAAAAAE